MADQQSKTFLTQRVNPILEKLVVSLVVNRPDNVTQYMIDWLKDKGFQLEQNLKDQGKQFQEDSQDEDSEEGEELMDKKSLQILKKDKEMRVSVSAEAYGKYHQKKDFKAKIINKSEDQKKRIRERLNQAFMFQSLDEVDKEIVVAAMEEKNFNKDQTIIKQGEDGEELYVVDSGELDCFRKQGKDGKEDKIKSYGPGDSFGELALLYNAPRAATIIAKSDVTLYSLDRETFNNIVKVAAAKKREKYEQFLTQVEILHTLTPYERLQIADALKSQSFNAGEYIVKEGDQGDIFFILEHGQCTAYKVLESGKDPEKVMDYKPGDYFGELALLKNSIRQASIKADTNVSVVYMDRGTFKRLSGPLEDILRRNFQKYDKFMSI